MRAITLDVETSNDFAEVGSNRPENLRLSVACIHDSETDTLKGFFEEELSELWPILRRADLIIGFNSEHFDLPLLHKYYAGSLRSIKSLDLLKEIKKTLGRRLKLDTVAEATLGRKKSGNGLDAIRWWKKGEREKVRQYCLEDVKITRELYDFARSHGHLKYGDRGIIKEIPLSTADWESLPEKNSQTAVLPF
jgi:DEAD/DEAH box helicase domain-containing protein